MKLFKKAIILLALCMLIIIPQTGCSENEPVSKEQFCLDTVCVITVYGEKKSSAEKIIDEAFGLCREYEDMLSKTVEGSDVYRINHAAGEPVEVCDDTLALIRKGIEFGEMSDGRFDITIGAVSELWDFNTEDPQLPDEDAIQSAVETVDYTQIKLDGNKVSLLNEGAQIDLGGIAKGYIADRLAEAMAAAGVGRAVINLGGNIVVIGEKEPDVPWKIGIERPYSDRTDIIASLEAADASVTTSGVYERCFTLNGRTYHHVLDPDTGYPMETEFEAVTVKAPIGMSSESDAFGTMFLIMGIDASREILKKYPEIGAAFVSGNDKIYTVNDVEIETVE